MGLEMPEVACHRHVLRVVWRVGKAGQISYNHARQIIVTNYAVSVVQLCCSRLMVSAKTCDIEQHVKYVLQRVTT
jgi:hypothetical protein